MTFEITLTKEHYDRYCSLMRDGVYEDRPKQILQPDFTITILFGVSLILFAAGVLVPGELIGKLLIGASGGFALFWASAYLISWLQVKTSRRLLEPQEDDPLYATTEYTFAEDHIELKSAYGTGQHPTDKFKKFVDEDELMLIFRSNREAYIFPKAQLSDTQIVFLQEWASEQIPTS